MYLHVKVKDLQLGDQVRLCPGDAEYNVATVERVSSQFVTLFRPYVLCDMKERADGTAACMVSLEQVNIPRDSRDIYKINRPSSL